MLARKRKARLALKRALKVAERESRTDDTSRVRSLVRRFMKKAEE